MIEEVRHLGVLADVGEVPVGTDLTKWTHLELVARLTGLVTTHTHTRAHTGTERERERERDKQTDRETSSHSSSVD